MQQTVDGGYIICGKLQTTVTDFNAWLIKTDSAGTEEWNKTFGADGYYDWAGSVHQTSDGGYILTGYTNSFGGGNENLYLIYYKP